MKKEFQLLLTAFMFYTRINVGKWLKYEPSYLSDSTKYLPLIGWITGGSTVLTYWGASQFLPLHVAVILSVTVSVLITGAFHEDGLADVCDGFGGGWKKDRILEIMKDSSIGTYGAAGLILLFSIKISLLATLCVQLSLLQLALALLSAHAMSRFIATTFLFTHAYARNTTDSKAKDYTQNPSLSILFVGAVFFIIPLGALCFQLDNHLFLVTILPCYLTKHLLGNYFQKWISGYTGDCLGATQQLSEIVFYITLLGLWKFI